MSMSRNSLDSKISRQSRHSTYSASWSRETIWTRGWRHCWSMDLLYKRLGVLRADWLMFARNTSPTVRGTAIVRYFRPAGRVVKHFLQAKYLILQLRSCPPGPKPSHSRTVSSRISDIIHRHSLSRSLLSTYSWLQEMTARCKGLQWNPGAS